jgi:hypothetical protein
MTKTETKNIPSRTSEYLKILFMGSIVVLLLSGIIWTFWLIGKKVWDTASYQNMSEESWNTLALTSPEHGILVKTYRDCRTQVFGKTVAECLLVANDYGKLSGIEDQHLTRIILDIKSTCTLIAEKIK